MKKSVTDLKGLLSYTEHLNQGGFPTPSATLVSNKHIWSESVPASRHQFCVPPGRSGAPQEPEFPEPGFPGVRRHQTTERTNFSHRLIVQ